MAFHLDFAALGEKAGPLPLWGWVGIVGIGGTVVLKLLAARKPAAAAPTTIPQQPTDPFAGDLATGSVDSSYGGSGSYVSYWPPTAPPSTPPTPPPSTPPAGACSAQFPLQPTGQASGWTAAHPIGYFQCLVASGCKDGSQVLPYCHLFQSQPDYTVMAFDTTGQLVKWRPGAQPQQSSGDVASLTTAAPAIPEPGRLPALPATHSGGSLGGL